MSTIREDVVSIGFEVENDPCADLTGTWNADQRREWLQRYRKICCVCHKSNQ